MALGDGELNALALLEAAVAIGDDGGEVDEDVRTTLASDEAIALGGIEPLDGALLLAISDGGEGANGNGGHTGDHGGLGSENGEALGEVGEHNDD